MQEAIIIKWLLADKLAPRKQRHTAKRVFKRLKDEADGFNCSYRLAALYVKQKKEKLRLKRTDGYLPLEHRPGEAQADFGTADFYENGKLHHEAKYIVLSFPFSNGGFLQPNYGENMECFIDCRLLGSCQKEIRRGTRRHSKSPSKQIGCFSGNQTDPGNLSRRR